MSTMSEILETTNPTAWFWKEYCVWNGYMLLAYSSGAETWTNPNDKNAPNINIPTAACSYALAETWYQENVERVAKWDNNSNLSWTRVSVWGHVHGVGDSLSEELPKGWNDGDLRKRLLTCWTALGLGVYTYQRLTNNLVEYTINGHTLVAAECLETWGDVALMRAFVERYERLFPTKTSAHLESEISGIRTDGGNRKLTPAVMQETLDLMRASIPEPDAWRYAGYQSEQEWKENHLALKNKLARGER